jgi:hypothetical protein
VGTPVEIRKRAFVSFSITPVGGVGGGEFLFPTGDSTDASGQVSTTFNAGNKAGVVQIVAQANISGRIIKSTPVRLTIFGGLPDVSHFTASLKPTNMPGWREEPGRVGRVYVQVGDKFGNPVQPGTALYFTTTGGLVQASARTDDLGFAVVDLLGGNPRPRDGGVAGKGHVTVLTVGEGGVSISKDIPFLFSGSPSVTLVNVPRDTVRLFDGAFFDVEYTVADSNGNPLSAGHSVSVTVSGQGSAGASLTGDVSVLTPDTEDKVNFTKYRFRVLDNVSNGGPSGELVFTITVTGESGTFVRKFYGFLYPAQVATTVPPTARRPAQIAFLGITAQDLYVAGVGNVENAVITYQVNDSLGVPIDKLQKTYAIFDLVFEPNSFTGGGTPPKVIPGADSTDDGGRLRASIVSGTQAGTITIVTRINLPGGLVVQSQPVKLSVHAGFADQAHFSLLPSRYSFADKAAIPPSVPVLFAVSVGDTFSNPVQANTAVYFNSQAGVMTTGTTSGGFYTDKVGYANAGLYTVNPKPLTGKFGYVPGPADPHYTEMGGGSPGGLRKGYHWVWASTQGRGGKRITDSVLVLWTFEPITVTGVPVGTVVIPQGGTSLPISITVKDANGNPLPSGTTINATVSYTTDVAGIAFGVSGDISTKRVFTMPNAGYARFTGSGLTDFTFQVSDLSTGGGATIGQTVIVDIYIDAPGLAPKVISFPCRVQ